MNIRDIARIAGVSTSTVSKIVNGKDSSISEETRKKVPRPAVLTLTLASYNLISRKHFRKMIS